MMPNTATSDGSTIGSDIRPSSARRPGKLVSRAKARATSTPNTADSSVERHAWSSVKRRMRHT